MYGGYLSTVVLQLKPYNDLLSMCPCNTSDKVIKYYLSINL